MKVIPFEYWSSSKFEEKSILKKLKGQTSENLVDVIDIFIENSFQYIVLEYCEDGDFRNKINKKKLDNSAYDFNEITLWTNQIIKGLEVLHSKYKIIHRDIKPENILLHKNTVKIADFGISTILFRDLSCRSTQVGTFNYWSPEIEKNILYDYKTDIWSTGCVIFELITLNFFRKLLNSKSKQIFKNIPINLIYLIKRMLVIDSEKRATSITLCNELNKTINIEYTDLSMEYWTKPFEQTLSNYSFEDCSIYYESDQIKFEKIKEIFFKNNNQILILKSEEMSGKTRLAKEVAKRFLANSYHAFFIDANSFENDLAKIYSLLQLKKTKQMNLIDVSKHIINQDINAKILFVIDDLKNDLNEYLNGLIPNNVYALITTRNVLLEFKNSISIELNQFDDKESVKFLEVKLKSRLSNDEDKKSQLECIQNLVKRFSTNRLYNLLQLVEFFEKNELNSFDEIIEIFEKSFSF